jgi:aminopyrrolnitrin oxygenase
MTSVYEQVKPSTSTQLKTQVDNKDTMKIPASWYVAMHSKDLGQQPKVIELFGRSLVAWRDQNNHPVIMEPYCSHMGANLAIGKVIDGCIQCPFHHWRYDSSGQCVSMPEVERIPPKARQGTYVTTEKYGYVWVWYGSVTPLFSLPKFSPAEDERHCYMRSYIALDTNTTVRRVVENGFDYYHVVPVHEHKFSGSIQVTPLADIHLEKQNELPIEKEAWLGMSYDFPIERIATPIGVLAQALGFYAKVLTVRVDAWPSGLIYTIFADGKERYKALYCTTPVAENNTKLVSLMAVKKTGNFLLDLPSYMLMPRNYKLVVAQDIAVWNSLKSDEGKAYIKHDWAVLKFRDLYQNWVQKIG